MSKTFPALNHGCICSEFKCCEDSGLFWIVLVTPINLLGLTVDGTMVIQDEPSFCSQVEEQAGVSIKSWVNLDSHICETCALTLTVNHTASTYQQNMRVNCSSVIWTCSFSNILG